MNEHEHEPVWGLPEILPDGEHILWQGQPAWKQMALQVFHVRKVAIYFALLIAIHVGLQWSQGVAPAAIAQGSSWLLALGLSAIAILALLARLYSRTTIYTITNRRLVLRFGVAVPMMINIPWDKIDAVDLMQRGHDSGDILLTLGPQSKMSYWLLWPHAKPWNFSPVRPSLRALDEVDQVVAQVRQAIGGNANAPTPAIAQRRNPDSKTAVGTTTRTAAYT
jgi:hypothetical protein